MMNNSLKIPWRLVSGDSASWTDGPVVGPDGTSYDATAFTLKYQLRGDKELLLTATPSGSNWLTLLSTAASAGLSAGTYWWTAQVSAAGVRVTVGRGQIVIEQDLAAANGQYTGLSFAEQALADAESALANFKKGGGRVKAYTIGGRQMTYQDDLSLIKVIEYWKIKIANEKSAASRGRSRFITQTTVRG